MISHLQLNSYKKLNTQLIEINREMKSEIYHLRVVIKNLNEELHRERERAHYFEAFTLNIYNTAENVIAKYSHPTQIENHVSIVSPVLLERDPPNLSFIAEESLQASMDSPLQETQNINKSPIQCHINSRRDHHIEVTPPLALRRRGTESSGDTLNLNKENVTPQEHSFALNNTNHSVPCSTPLKPAPNADDDLKGTDVQNTSLQKCGPRKSVQVQLIENAISSSSDSQIETSPSFSKKSSTPEVNNNLKSSKKKNRQSSDTTTTADPLSSINVVNSTSILSSMLASATVEESSISAKAVIRVKQPKLTNGRVQKQKKALIADNNAQQPDASDIELTTSLKRLRTPPPPGVFTEPKLNIKLRRPTKK